MEMQIQKAAGENTLIGQNVFSVSAEVVRSLDRIRFLM